MAWTKGQSGNPNGRPKGKKDKITFAYLRDIERHWRKNGPAALDLALAESPAAYVAAVGRLIPKDIQHNHLHELSAGFAAAIRAAQHTSPSVTVINGSAEHIDDDAKALIPLDTQRSKDSP